MKEYLNFNENYNGKLGLKYFTTIRSLVSIREKKLHKGDIVEIQQDHIAIFCAQIVSIEEIELYDMSESQKTLLMLDLGIHWTQAVNAIARLCNSHKVAVVTLMKIVP